MNDNIVFYDAIIVGAGAAGLMCAISAGRNGRKVLLIDHYKRVGEKIRISGGGRSNFTNLNETVPNLISSNPNFFISALKRFSNRDFIALIEKYSISYHEKTLGQLFCDDSAKQIIDMLLTECAEVGVEIKLNSSINKISKAIDGFAIEVKTDDLHKIFRCKSFVVATGGLSIPKIGASDLGYKIAKQFSLNIIKTNPALVPFTLSEDLLENTKELSGISVDATVSCNKKKFSEALLFTHKGLSGPVILQISSYWNYGDAIVVNMAPEIDLFSRLQDERKQNPKKEIVNILAQILPKKLVNYIVNKNNCWELMANISDKKLREIANNINNWIIIPSGTEGFLKAEVTKGGVDTKEISSKTFESKNVRGLYFIGEVLDVTGHLGGYNFQWAWSSGYCCGQFI